MVQDGGKNVSVYGRKLYGLRDRYYGVLLIEEVNKL
jgi:hypothetical protein